MTLSILPRNGKCKKIEEGQECLQGMRLRQYHMLCGALLRVWKRVSDVVSDITSSSILQIVRLRTKQHNKQVGGYTQVLLRVEKVNRASCFDGAAGRRLSADSSL